MANSEWKMRANCNFPIRYSLLTIRLDLFGDRHDLARARHARPRFVEIRDQALDHARRGTPVERGAVGELIKRPGPCRSSSATPFPRGRISPRRAGVHLC